MADRECGKGMVGCWYVSHQSGYETTSFELIGVWLCVEIVRKRFFKIATRIIKVSDCGFKMGLICNLETLIDSETNVLKKSSSKDQKKIQIKFESEDLRLIKCFYVVEIMLFCFTLMCVTKV